MPFELKIVRGNEERTVSVGGASDRGRRGVIGRSVARVDRRRAAVRRLDAEAIEDAESSMPTRSAVSTAAERLIPSVASLRVGAGTAVGWRHRLRRRVHAGRLPPDHRPMSSPARTGGPATFVDGDGARRSRSSDAIRSPTWPSSGPPAAAWPPHRSATRPGSGSASWSSRSATRSASPARSRPAS